MEMRGEDKQGGFTLIEVAVASIITMIGLFFLASLFTLAITQNRLVKQFTSTLALAQAKIEELNAVDPIDVRLREGGNLTSKDTTNGVNYFDAIYVDEHGKIFVGDEIPQEQVPQYTRFWRVEKDTELDNAMIISVRVVSLQPGRNTGAPEETTLATVRSW
ncbi:MAG TPA: prepilin-type N-terminal cleavage/methylation domain-containing protein [Blastocatellia bacterium]|nr:prepilin-type N-terminal cleavage/methylation domain-containing protein [Blastocatellia bacterium]